MLKMLLSIREYKQIEINIDENLLIKARERTIVC